MRVLERVLNWAEAFKQLLLRLLDRIKFYWVRSVQPSKRIPTKKKAVRFIRKDFYIMICFWKHEKNKRKKTQVWHIIWELPVLFLRSIYILIFSIFPIYVQVILVRTFILAVVFQKADSISELLFFFTPLILITVITQHPDFQQHIRRIYGKRAFYLLGLQKPANILSHYLMWCSLALVVLLLIWIVAGPVADAVNIDHCIRIYYRAIDEYEREVNSILIDPNLRDDFTLYPEKPHFDQMQELIPSRKTIGKFVDLIKTGIQQ